MVYACVKEAAITLRRETRCHNLGMIEAAKRTLGSLSRKKREEE